MERERKIVGIQERVNGQVRGRLHRGFLGCGACTPTLYWRAMVDLETFQHLPALNFWSSSHRPAPSTNPVL